MTAADQVTRWKRLVEHPSRAMVFSGVDLPPRRRIYRYLPWDSARELFERERLRLASPRSWVDPYERWWCDLLFRPSSQLHGANAFACCRSTRYADEPYWRLYDLGGTRAVVRLGTTVQRVLDTLSSAVATMPAKAFVGRVRYRPTIELERAAHGVKIGSEKGSSRGRSEDAPYEALRLQVRARSPCCLDRPLREWYRPVRTGRRCECLRPRDDRPICLAGSGS